MRVLALQLQEENASLRRAIGELQRRSEECECRSAAADHVTAEGCCPGD